MCVNTCATRHERMECFTRFVGWIHACIRYKHARVNRKLNRIVCICRQNRSAAARRAARRSDYKMVDRAPEA